MADESSGVATAVDRQAARGTADFTPRQLDPLA